MTEGQRIAEKWIESGVADDDFYVRFREGPNIPIGGFCDISCSNEESAHLVAEASRRYLAADIDAAIAEAVRAEREAGFEAFVFAIETMLLQAPELNMSNYNDDYVAALNSATISAYLYVKERADAIRASSSLYQPQQDAANPMFEGGDA